MGKPNEIPLAELPPLDADRLRAVAMLVRCGGTTLCDAADQLGLYPDAKCPGNSLQHWCTRHRTRAWREALEWAEGEAAPELERLARQVLYGTLTCKEGVTHDQRLKAAQIVLSDRRRAEEIGVRKELLNARFNVTIIDPFERIPEERRAQLAQSAAVAEHGLRLVEDDG